MGGKKGVKKKKIAVASTKIRPATHSLSKKIKPAKHAKSNVTIKKAAETKKIQPINENLTRDVSPEFNFWLCDGRVLKNALDLANAAATMTDETYSNHANFHKNDFADWTRDILKDEQLAYYIRKSSNKKEMEAAIRKAIGGLPKEPEAAKKELPPVKIEIPEIKIKTESQKKPEPQKPAPDIPKAKQIIPAPKIIPEPVKKAPTELLTIPQDGPEKDKLDSIIKPDERLEKIRKREEELAKLEKEISEEEQRVNQEKIELTKKRYELLKRRGDIEKEKFEHFLIQREKKMPAKISFEYSGESPLPNSGFGKERIESIIKETRELIAQRKTEDAAKKHKEANEFFERAFLKPDDKRNLKFQIMELEADIKLASIKPTQ